MLALLSYKVANTKVDNKVYDPFEILGLSTVRCFHLTSLAISVEFSLPSETHRETHFISMSLPGYIRKRDQVSLQEAFKTIVRSCFLAFTRPQTLPSHPDKVKLEGNDTIESASARFVDITKAYKS